MADLSFTQPRKKRGIVRIEEVLHPRRGIVLAQLLQLLEVVAN